jgi:hypothetical protein
MTDFLHKWELPLRAYAQLRTQEVRKKKKTFGRAASHPLTARSGAV